MHDKIGATGGHDRSDPRDQFRRIAFCPIAKTLAIHAGCPIEHGILACDQGRCGRFQAEHRLAMQDDEAIGQGHRLARFFDHAFLENLKGRIIIVKSGFTEPA